MTPHEARASHCATRVSSSERREPQEHGALISVGLHDVSSVETGAAQEVLTDDGTEPERSLDDRAACTGLRSCVRSAGQGGLERALSNEREWSSPLHFATRLPYSSR